MRANVAVSVRKSGRIFCWSLPSPRFVCRCCGLACCSGLERVPVFFFFYGCAVLCCRVCVCALFGWRLFLSNFCRRFDRVVGKILSCSWPQFLEVVAAKFEDWIDEVRLTCMHVLWPPPKQLPSCDLVCCWHWKRGIIGNSMCSRIRTGNLRDFVRSQSILGVVSLCLWCLGKEIFMQSKPNLEFMRLAGEAVRRM